MVQQKLPFVKKQKEEILVSQDTQQRGDILTIIGGNSSNTYSQRRGGTQNSQKLPAGLKELSMRVMEQVIKDGKTTYKKVATQLIEILKKDGGHLQFTQE